MKENGLDIDNLSSDERKAFDFLNRCDGLTVKPIPKENSQTADFLLDDNGRGYIVEVKSREDDEEWKRSLRNGDVAIQERKLGSGKWAEKVAKKALKQIKTVDPDHNRWWMLWLSIECEAGSEAMFEQAINSLFGVRQVLQVLNSANARARDCLYATPGVFERHKEIVAAVVSQGKRTILCLNEFAKDFYSFQESILCNWFPEYGVVVSANSLKKKWNYLAVEDREIDRKDDRAIAEYLEKKCDFKKVMICDPADHSGTILVPDRAKQASRHQESDVDANR